MSKGKTVGMTNEEFDTWLSTQPTPIQELGRRYPPGVYQMKEDAPYMISCPGTIVHFYSYHMDGTMSVVVPAENKLPIAKRFERMQGRIYNKTEEELRFINEADILLEVDPRYMEPFVEAATKKKKIQIWSEGYRATGEHQTAIFHGEYEAENFDEAMKLYMADHPGTVVDIDTRLKHDSPGQWRTVTRYSTWACEFYDNEADARKAFG